MKEQRIQCRDELLKLCLDGSEVPVAHSNENISQSEDQLDGKHMECDYNYDSGNIPG